VLQNSRTVQAIACVWGRVIYEIRKDELVILVLKIGPRGGIY